MLSPADRAALWHRAITAPPEEREGMLRVLAKAMAEVAGDGLEVYDDLDERFEETLRLLDRPGLIGREELRVAFEVVGVDESGERAVESADLVLILAGLLEEVAADARLGRQERVAALEAAGRWRDLVETEGHPGTGADLSVAQVAAHFGVTPQAVYKWCERGKIEFERTPGGSYRIPAGQFDLGRGRGGDAARRRAAARLLEKYGSTEVDEEELADGIRKARRAG